MIKVRLLINIILPLVSSLEGTLPSPSYDGVIFYFLFKALAPWLFQYKWSLLTSATRHIESSCGYPMNVLKTRPVSDVSCDTNDSTALIFLWLYNVTWCLCWNNVQIWLGLLCLISGMSQTADMTLISSYDVSFYTKCRYGSYFALWCLWCQHGNRWITVEHVSRKTKSPSTEEVGGFQYLTQL